MHYDVVIIGAGFSGLAAGVRLAHFGRRVLIVEKHTVWGGLNSFYKKGGHALDTGLHAVTNWVRPGYRGPRLPLERVARQLRIDLAELGLEPQTRSQIVFGDVKLSFSNDPEVFDSEIERSFPGQIDGFERLRSRCTEYPDLTKDAPRVSSRRMLQEYVRDPLLREMILAPVFFYGSAEENDIDFDQFIVLFNSIFREGFARPRGGIRQILDVLVRRYAESGGEMRRGCGVRELSVEDARVKSIVLESGEAITGDVVLSSAGLVETMRLRTDIDRTAYQRYAGRLAFMETIWVVRVPPKTFGHDACVTFFNEDDRFRWECPDSPIDLRSGVISCPTNYDHAQPLEELTIRATHLANARTWLDLSASSDRYRAEKEAWRERSLQVVSRHTGDFRAHVAFVDAFTPKTVRHFTGKENGAIYGSWKKLKTGATEISNLFLCGTDQGLPGIVGAMLSGIHMANLYGLGRSPGARSVE